MISSDQHVTTSCIEKEEQKILLSCAVHREDIGGSPCEVRSIISPCSKPLTKEYILKNIWGYSSDADTHTIETHIYRLRQKIKNKFNDENFIKHTKEGYSF